MDKVQAALVGFGEINTPIELTRKQFQRAQQLLQETEIECTTSSVVRDDADAEEVAQAIGLLSENSFDLLVVCITGWVPSWVVVKLVDGFRHKPILLWGLEGWIDGDRLVTTAAQAGTSALRKVFSDMGYSFKFVYNSPSVQPRMKEILSFARAAVTVRRLRDAKVGLMGYRDMQLYGTMFDGVSLRRVIGVEVEFFEMLEVYQKSEEIAAAPIDSMISQIEENWHFEKKADRTTLAKGVKYYLSIRDIVRRRDYEAVSLIDVDGMKKLLNFPPAMIFMLLGENEKICTIPENDVLGAVTQLIVRFLTGQIAPYMEFYEFMEDRVLMGVPDFVPSEVVDGRVKVIPTSFGDIGEGILNISAVKTGKVTLSRLTSVGDRYSMHVATGEAVSPRAWEEAGWKPPAPQLPSLEVILDKPVEEFAQEVLSQHYIIAYGDITLEIADLCRLLGISLH